MEKVGCIDDCVYSKEGSDKQFCFAVGDFEPECIADNSSPMEKAKSNFTLKDGENTFMCDIEFVYQLNQGFQVKSPVSSNCQKSEMKNNSVGFLDEKKFLLTSNSSINFDCKINIIFTNDGRSSIKLLDEALKKSLSCNTTEDSCITTGGPSYPARCISTFRYNGTEFHGCTDRDQHENDTRLWCATGVNEDLEVLPNMWGFCNDKCGYCGGSAVNSSSRNIPFYRPCGYDCLINPFKLMEGSYKEPLLPPSVITSEEILYWNKLPKGQYRFLVGDPSVILHCKHTKFSDPMFQDARTIVASCGPSKQYRFTVKDLEGNILDGEVKNTRFGCSACPVGFDYMNGYTDIKSYNSLGEFNEIGNEKECKELCEEKGCKSFIFSFKNKKCKLAKNHFTKTEYLNHEDYNVCTKKLDCCEALEISSSGDTKTYQGARLGTYKKTGEKYNNRDVYKQTGGSKIMYFRGEEDYGWVVSSGVTSYGGLRSAFDFDCPSDAIQWEYYLFAENKWIEDRDVELTCDFVCKLDRVSLNRAVLPDIVGQCECISLPFFEVNAFGCRSGPTLRWGVQRGGFADKISDIRLRHCITGNTRAEYSEDPCLDDEEYLFNKYLNEPEPLKSKHKSDKKYTLAYNEFPKGSLLYAKIKEANAGLPDDDDDDNKQDFYIAASNKFKREAGKDSRKTILSLKDLEDNYITEEGHKVPRDCKDIKHTDYDITDSSKHPPAAFKARCTSGKGPDYKLCKTQENIPTDKIKTSDQRIVKDFNDKESLDSEILLTIDTENSQHQEPLLTDEEVERIKKIPDSDKPNGRMCGLSREQFAKGRGAFGDAWVKGKKGEWAKREDNKGLAEKHFILDQKDEDTNKEAAKRLSEHRGFPDGFPQINTVFVVDDEFTNEVRKSMNPQFPGFCEDYRCLLDYTNLKLFYDGPSSGFELKGFKGLPSVRTNTVRDDPHKRAISSFCIMRDFVKTYQCIKENKKDGFICEELMLYNGSKVKVKVKCVAVIDDALDSVGHLYGYFCKEESTS